MLFQSYAFIFLFLPVVLAVYYALLFSTDRKLCVGWLVAASFFFYAWHVPAYLALLCASITVNFAIGLWLGKRPSKAIVALGVALNLGALAYFKYAGFIVFNVGALLSLDATAPEIILPIAISFFTFQQVAYLADVYRTGRPRRSPLNYALFVAFFPQLIAGPIVHHAEVVPQFAKLAPRRVAINLSIGLTIFSLGLFKKLAIADSLGVYADIVFDVAAQGQAPGLVECWVGAIAYTFQIYFDFSGYSDMAVGLGRMFGIILPLNFFSPYKSGSIIEFWRRWHITLSRFLRNYLYFPLGGNRKGAARRSVNVMVVMLLGGLWHGAGWTFVVWGGLHGIFLMINQLWRRILPAAAPGPVVRVLYWGLTMLAVVVAWVPFRAADMAAAVDVWYGMVGGHGVFLPRSVGLALGPLASTLSEIGVVFTSFADFRTVTDIEQLVWFPIAAVIAFVAPNVYQWIDRFRPAFNYDLRPLRPARALAWRPTLAWGGAVSCLALFGLAYQVKTVEFLYFQF